MKYVFAITFSFLSQFLLGQNPYFNTIDKSQGLLTNSVYDIFQDKDDYMWFATEKGLCQFNGYTFRYFSQEGMTSKAGSCIQQDTFGRIWYENFDGYLYYVENNQLKKLNQSKSIGYFKFGIIQNRLYVLNENSIDVYDLQSLNLTKRIKHSTKEVKSIFFANNTIYVFADTLVIIQDDKVQKRIDFPKEFLTNFTSILVEKAKTGLFIGSKFSDYCYLFSNGRFVQKSLNIKNTIVQNLSWCDTKNWLCTTSGIIEMDSESGAKREFFKGTNISYIYKTKNNNFWISTLTEGLFYIEDFDTNLIRSQESLTSLCYIDDQLLIGTKNDKILTLDNKEFKTIYTGKDNHQIGQLFYDNPSKKTLFTSSKFGVLDSHQKLTKEIAIAVKSVSPIDSKYIVFAASSSSGIFKTNTDATSPWDTVFNSFPISESKDYSTIISNAKGKSTAYDNLNKTIYYATNNGLFYITPTGFVTELKYKNTTLNLAKLSFAKGKIYACNGDFDLFQIENNTISKINFPKHIQKATIEKIILKEDLLFMVTNKYIFEYQLNTGIVKQILHINSNIEVNDIILKKGIYSISTNRGLILKKQQVYNRSHPIFSIERITVNGKEVNDGNLDNLAYNENNIHINYRFLSPTPFEEHELLYRINESQWQKGDIVNTQLVLNSLNHGNYTVEFLLNSDYTNSIKINFTINRPLWLQFPFLFGASLIALGFTYWLYRKSILKIKKRNQLILDKINLEKNVNQSKLKAIKSQMNPHFFYNALNTLQSFILSNEKRMAIDYLSKFSNLTRTILEMTEKESISIAEEVKTLQLYLEIEKGRFDEDFSYDIQVDQTIDQESLKIPTMLLQPYVENAVKHGLLHKQGDKKVTITFEIQNNTLLIGIDDNGVGRQKSGELNQIKNKNHQSFATEALQNRIDLLNEYNRKNISLNIIDKHNLQNQPNGTLVEIIIPIEIL